MKGGTRVPVAAGAVCRGCGYELTGIDADGRCPECGIAIRGSIKKRLGDSITDAPSSYLGLLMASCWLAMLTSVGSVAAYGASGYWFDEMVPRIAWVVGTIFWVLAVYLLTSDRQSRVVPPGEVRKEWFKVRWAARLLQFGFVGAAGLSVYKLQLMLAANPGIRVFPTWGTTPPLIEELNILTTVLLLLGLIGIGLMCLYLASLAYWARDEDLESRFRSCSYFLCGGLPLFLILSPFAASSSVLGILAFGVALVSIGLASWGWIVFQWSLIQLAMLSAWAVSSANAEIERDRRMVERAEAERQAALDREYAAPPPVNLLGSGDGVGKSAPKVKPKGAYVERKGDAEGYELAE